MKHKKTSDIYTYKGVDKNGEVFTRKVTYSKSNNQPSTVIRFTCLFSLVVLMGAMFFGGSISSNYTQYNKNYDTIVNVPVWNESDNTFDYVNETYQVNYNTYDWTTKLNQLNYVNVFALGDKYNVNNSDYWSPSWISHCTNLWAKGYIKPSKSGWDGFINFVNKFVPIHKDQTYWEFTNIDEGPLSLEEKNDLNALRYNADAYKSLTCMAIFDKNIISLVPTQKWVDIANNSEDNFFDKLMNICTAPFQWVSNLMYDIGLTVNFMVKW